MPMKHVGRKIDCRYCKHLEWTPIHESDEVLVGGRGGLVAWMDDGSHDTKEGMRTRMECSRVDTDG